MGQQSGARAAHELQIDQHQQWQQKWSAQHSSLQHAYELADTKRKMAIDALAALGTVLDQQQRLSSNDQAELELYRRISGSEVSTGLSVNSIFRSTGKDKTEQALHVTLIQARGRNPVQGQMNINLVGQKAGLAYNIKATQAFGFRFFEKLTVPLKVADMNVSSVQIDVLPTGKSHKAFTYTSNWDEISLISP